MIRRPPRSTLDRSSAASDVYKRQAECGCAADGLRGFPVPTPVVTDIYAQDDATTANAVSYTHLRAHETVLDLVCRLLLEKKKTKTTNSIKTYTLST